MLQVILLFGTQVSTVTRTSLAFLVIDRFVTLLLVDCTCTPELSRRSSRGHVTLREALSRMLARLRRDERACRALCRLACTQTSHGN